MFQWEKKGLIFNPETCEQRPAWRWNYAQGENTLLYDQFIRVYFCCREKPDEKGRTISRVAYVDLSRENPCEILKIGEKPVLEPGGLGEFDEFGTYPFSVVRHNNQIYGYFGGITRGESVPFYASIGCAVSTDDGESFQKIGPGPVLTASLHEPYIMPAMDVCSKQAGNRLMENGICFIRPVIGGRRSRCGRKSVISCVWRSRTMAFTGRNAAGIL